MDYWAAKTEAHSLASSFLIWTQSPHIPKVLHSHFKCFRIARMEVGGLHTKKLTYKITSSPCDVIFSHFPWIWEFVLIISVNTSVLITNNSKDRGHPCLIALFNPISPHVYPWTQTPDWNLMYMALIRIRRKNPFSQVHIRNRASPQYEMLLSAFKLRSTECTFTEYRHNTQNSS